jgi:hypothetical protein
MNAPSATPAAAANVPRSLSHHEREALFGRFEFTHSPIAPRLADRARHLMPVVGDPEHVTISAPWVAEHIVKVSVPQLVMRGKPLDVWIHKLIERQFLALWEAWQEDGLLPLVVTWNGSFVTRFKRRAGPYAERAARCAKLGAEGLSNHCWGSAFDINAAFNGLGTDGALVGEPGCVRALVPAAEAHGFYWGGHFHDPMHFEAFKVLT